MYAKAYTAIRGREGISLADKLLGVAATDASKQRGHGKELIVGPCCDFAVCRGMHHSQCNKQWREVRRMYQGPDPCNRAPFTKATKARRMEGKRSCVVDLRCASQCGAGLLQFARN